MGQQPDKIQEPLLRASVALGRACAAVADFICAMAQFVAEVLPLLPDAMELQAALNEAPPRVRHLAAHGKKRRTRKKNIRRALREHKRGAKK